MVCNNIYKDKAKRRNFDQNLFLDYIKNFIAKINNIHQTDYGILTDTKTMSQKINYDPSKYFIEVCLYQRC